MVFAADYPLLDVFWTMILFFTWAIWIWMVFAIFADMFARHDLSGWAKAAWAVFVIVVPFLGVLIYLIKNSEQMAERKARQMQSSRADFDDHIKRVAAPGGAATEIENAKQLLDSGTITAAEFDGLKAKALA
jgi:predicted PurR-regulated permease PerM